MAHTNTWTFLSIIFFFSLFLYGFLFFCLSFIGFFFLTREDDDDDDDDFLYVDSVRAGFGFLLGFVHDGLIYIVSGWIFGVFCDCSVLVISSVVIWVRSGGLLVLMASLLFFDRRSVCRDVLPQQKWWSDSATHNLNRLMTRSIRRRQRCGGSERDARCSTVA